jgi:RNA polymerase sigma-70 factor (ECF subfamily)
MVGDTAVGVEIADDELVELARGGDGEAFRTLVDRHRSWLIARCRRHLGGDAHAAEDVAQECFVALQRTLAKSNRPMHVRPWLSVVARNRCIDETRKRRALPIPIVPDSAVYDAEVGTEDPHLARAWSALTGRHRAVLELRELGGMSYDEIAVALAVTSGAVETLLFRARTALRREYARAGGKVAAMGPIEEAVQRATGGRGMLTRLAEQAGARFGDGAASAATAAGPQGQALAGAASNGSAAMSAGPTPSWLLDLQARLATSGLLDPVVQQGVGSGRLRVVLAGLGLLLGTLAVTVPPVDDGTASTPPPPPEAAVTVPSAPAPPSTPSEPDTTPSAPSTPSAEAPSAPPAPTPPADAGAAPSTGQTGLGSPVATTATTVVGAVSGAVDGVVDPVADGLRNAVDDVLGLPRR